MAAGKYLIKALVLGMTVIGLDAISKWWVNTFIPLMNWNLLYPFGGIGVFKDFLGVQFAVVHETNKGAAWGAFSDYQEYLLWLRIALITGLLFYLVFFNRKEKTTIPMVLIISGAIGNVIDFFFYGHVVDMIYLKFGSYHYPVFNLADSAIFIGVVWLAALTLFGKKQSNATKRKHPCN